MISRRFTTQAVVLKRFNYGEGDRILTLFTRNYGKMAVIAKGVRKPKSRKRGHVELFTHIKAQVARGRGMGILTEAESLRGFDINFPRCLTYSTSEVESQGDRIFYAYQFAELVDRLLPEEERNVEVFELLVKALLSISTGQVPLKNLDGYFKNRLIRILGFWPSERSVPGDVDDFLNEILERPLNSKAVWERMSF